MREFALVVVYNHTWQLIVHAWETNSHARVKCPHTTVTSHVEGDQFLNSQRAWGCWDMVARGTVFDIPRLKVKCTLSLTKWIHTDLSRIFMASKFQSKLRVLDKDDVKQKNSLFSVQGKSSWFLFFCFPSSVSARQFKKMPKLPSQLSPPPIYHMNFSWM